MNIIIIIKWRDSQMKVQCAKCGYTWESRVENPKACPFCKQYIKKPKTKEKDNTVAEPSEVNTDE